MLSFRYATKIGFSEFGLSAFRAGAVTQAIPGSIAQIILIPILVMVLKSIASTVSTIDLTEKSPAGDFFASFFRQHSFFLF